MGFIEIWAGFGPVGGIEKKNWADYEQLLREVFSCFGGQKNFDFLKKYCSVCTKKLYNISFIPGPRDTSPRNLCIMTLPLIEHH